MPYANNNGVRIRYEVEGEGPPLVLRHGTGLWLELFYDAGYVDGLKDEYRLILLDGRGCGASDKPHDPAAYELDAFVGDVCAVLDAEGIARAHFFGYSMGGWIGYGMARLAPGRVALIASDACTRPARSAG